jgi:acyl carrier protein
MTRDEIFAQVTGQMAEMFEIDPKQIKADALLRDDLDLDSIDAIDLAVKIEQFTGKRVDEHALRAVRTVNDVVDLVEKIAAGAAIPERAAAR